MPGPGFAAMAKERALALRKHIFSLPSARFEGKPLEVLKEINDFADNQRLPMTFRGYKMELAQRALSAMAPKPKVLVEFGTFVGCSALGWGAHLTELNGGSDGVRVYGFELDPEVAQIARDLVKLAGLEEVVTVLDGPGADSLKKLVGDGTVKAQSVDAVFIDHWEQLYVSDLRVCEELGVLHVGSIIMADNTDFPGAPDYVEYVRAGGSGQPGAVRYETESIGSQYSYTSMRAQVFPSQRAVNAAKTAWFLLRNRMIKGFDTVSLFPQANYLKIEEQ